MSPRYIVYMLFALIDLGYMGAEELHTNQSRLVSAINNSFNIKLSRESIVYGINKMEEKNKEDKYDSQKKREIESIKNKIKEEVEKQAF